jgi:ParB-like chromosome segregation protein Spo0J
MEFHEVANIFPQMNGEPFKLLVADIKANGLREEIWTHEGKIIDGRNRYRACEEAGVEPRCRTWDGNGSLVAFVVSLNLHRRHLSESQRAMVAAKIANWKVGENQYREEGGSIDLPSSPAVSNAQAAALLNVSEPSVKRAKRVRAQGVPELVEAVEKGALSVNAGAFLADAEPDEQRRLLAAGPKAVKSEANRERREESRLRPKNGNGKATHTRKLTGGRKAPAAIRAAIGTLAGLASGLDSFTVKDAAPSAEEAEQWEKDLALVISAINRFRRQLKEIGHV